MKIIIVGAGGHGQVVAESLQARAAAGSDIEILGFVDDGPVARHRFPVLGSVADLRAIPHDAAIVAIGDNITRDRLSERLRSSGERIISAIHPTAIVVGGVEIDDGAMVCAGAIAATGAAIGRGVILNTGSSIDHHCRVGEYAHIAPGAHLGGEVSIGRRVLVGIGARVLPRITVGHDAVIGAGAVVIRDVPPRTIVTGIPAVALASRGIAVAVRGGL
jgi:sugar O-acyltransferase (sialic acid O-acetyltransferase NeuD family)